MRPHVGRENKTGEDMTEVAIQGFRLSPQQRHLWSIGRLEELSPYRVRCAVTIDGNLDADVLRRSLEMVVDQNEILRTNFQYLPGMLIPAQVIASTRTLSIDSRHSSNEREPNEEIEGLLREFGHFPFDFEQGQLLHVALVAFSSSISVLLISLPALCADMMTLKNFVREISRCYGNCVNNEEPADEALQYADLAEWQNELLEEENARTGKEYRQKQDLSAVNALRIPFEHQYSEKVGFDPAFLSAVIEPGTIARIEALVDACDSSLRVFFLACWQLLLWRLTGETDIIIGAAYDGRNYDGLEEALGLFARYLPIRSHFDGEMRFIELLELLNESTREAGKWQEYFSWDQIASSSAEIKRDSFFPFAFDFEEQPDACSAAGLTLSICKWYCCIDRFKIRLACVQNGSSLISEFHYDSRLFSVDNIQRLSDHFTVLVASIINSSEAAIGALEILSDLQRHRILVEFNDTETEDLEDGCIHLLFEEQAGRTPDNVAVIFADQQLSYSRLNSHSNQLAHYLQAVGVGPETKVAICVERSLEMLIGLLGILKAGGAYVPLDAEYPEERLAFMIEDSRVRMLLSHEQLLSRLPKSEAKVICLDSHWEEISRESEEPPVSETTPENLAYLIYTSGSTGQPKGSLILHKGLANYLRWCAKAYPLLDGWGAPVHSSLAFDLTVTSIFATLLVGERVRFLGNDRDPEALSDALLNNEEEFSLIKVTPAHLDLLSERLSTEQSFSRARAIIIGGENLTARSIKFWQASVPDTALFNEYGPTETVVGCCVYQIPEGKQLSGSIPIGRPIANTQIHLLDGSIRPVPIGIPGELCVSGVGLSRGYLNRPDLTAEKFIPNPLSTRDGERLYMTGDLSRILPDNTIEFLSRVDNQVKIRGYRIELGEVKNSLLMHRGVNEAIVVCREIGDNGKQLIAYCVCSGELNETEIREELARDLPDYMIPSFFVALDRLPLTPNGKVDRKSLPPPENQMGSRASSQFIKPRNLIEEKLALIWSEILGTPRIGINDDFFELGGHSISAARIISRVHAELGAKIFLKDILDSRRISSFSEIVQQSISSQYSNIPILAEQNYYDLSHAQKGIWLSAQLEKEKSSLNIVSSFYAEAELNVDALRKSFETLVERHESLRTTFSTVDGEPKQKIHKDVLFELEEIDLSNEPDNYEPAESLIDTKVVEPFDLTRRPLFRAVLIKLQPRRYLFSLIIHHIIIDGWGLGILADEILTLYRAYVGGKANPLEPLKTQYRDFAAWHNEQLQDEHLVEAHRSYWLRQLSGELPVLNLRDYPRTAIQSIRGANHDFVLNKDVTEVIKEQSGQHHVTSYTTLLTVVYALLHRYTGQDDIIVGSPVSGRVHIELEGQIGYFINLLPLRVNINGKQTLKELLQNVKEVVLDADRHQMYPFDSLMKDLKRRRDLSRAPLFDVVVVQHNYQTPEVEGPRIYKVSEYVSRNPTSKWDLTFSFTEKNEGFHVNLRYNPDVFRSSTIQQLGRHYQELLSTGLSDLDRRIEDLELLAEAERQRICIELNDTAAEYRKDDTVPRLVEEQSEKTPDAVAALFEAEHLTYQVLNQQANQLAHALRGFGVRPEVCVGICLDRSLELVTGLLGILKAGGAYVPLGPAYPKERLSYMLDEADIAVLVTQWTLVESITKGAATFLCLDAERDFIRKQSQSNVQSGLLGSNPAYVIYTSGSTGRPKGAMNSHEAICNRLMWMQDTYRLDETDRVLQKTPFSFDVSVWEFFWPLLTGACLVVAAAGGERDSAYLQKVISETRISTIHFVPSMLQVVLEQSGIESCGSLRRVICSGEALSLQLQERFFAGLSSELHNLYGPTEAAIDVTSRHCWPDGSQRTVPIGRPITNTQIYVLDKHMVPVTTSVPGELHIGGVGLARGYVNQPDLTSEKFIPNPFGNASGSRLYKTGDLARYLPDGEIDFLQRIDNQVKIRGFRIEPGEIETVLSQLAGVREAVVTVKQDETGEKRLVAYIVHDRKQARAIAQLRSALKQKLPYYMIPSEFIALDSIPLMSNGKMDRRALRDLETAGPASETDYAEPRSELERTIASVWRQALNRGEVGIHDNFFDLGGHSLLLIKIHNQLQGQLDRDVSVVQMFQYPTISSLADHLSRVSHDGIDEEPSFQQAHDRAEKLKQAINLQMQIHAKREVVQ